MTETHTGEAEITVKSKRKGGLMLGLLIVCILGSGFLTETILTLRVKEV